MDIKVPNPNLDIKKNPGLTMSPKIPKPPKPGGAKPAKPADAPKIGMAPESKKDPIKEAEQLKDKDNKKEAMKEAVAMNKHGQWSTETLEKKKPSFNPREEQETDAGEKRDQWVNFDNNEAKEKIPRMEGSARVRATSKLAGSTDYRRNHDTNEVEFLMHRGMSVGELDNHHVGHDNSNKQGKTNYKPGTINGWTPDKSVAHDFGVYGGHPNGEGMVTSAWIPESQLHSSMKQYGGKDKSTRNMTSAEDEWLVSHEKPMYHHDTVEADKSQTKKPVMAGTAPEPKVKGKSSFSPDQIKAMEDVANKRIAKGDLEKGIGKKIASAAVGVGIAASSMMPSKAMADMEPHKKLSQAYMTHAVSDDGGQHGAISDLHGSGLVPVVHHDKDTGDMKLSLHDHKTKKQVMSFSDSADGGYNMHSKKASKDRFNTLKEHSDSIHGHFLKFIQHMHDSVKKK